MMQGHSVSFRYGSVVALAFTGVLSAHAQPRTTSIPSCLDYVEGMKQKIEANYAGFRLEIVGERRAEYEGFVESLREHARSIATDQCYETLHGFTTWFNDPHLFVFQSSRIDSAEGQGRRDRITRRQLSEVTVRGELQRRMGRLDPIEGIWTDGRLRVAVVPAGMDRFEAIVLTADSASWSPGDVRGTFVRENEGYRVTLVGRNYAERVLEGSIHKRVLLRISPEMWAREYPVVPEDAGLVDISDPRRPTLLEREGTVIVSIPSHSPAYKQVLDSMIARNADVFRDSPRLIVDLRGNEGGSSLMSDGLLPYILSDHELPERFPERGGAVMLSSPDQMAYARRAFGPDTTRFVRTLLERLEAEPGGFAPLMEPGQERPVTRPDSLIHGPSYVGVMIDEGTVSASEVLVLKALRSTRAVVFGLPTAGALDYQSTYIVPLVPGVGRWFLGYPTITRDTLLPLDGMRGNGIAPQVRLDWNLIPDPINHVDRALRGHP